MIVRPGGQLLAAVLAVACLISPARAQEVFERGPTVSYELLDWNPEATSFVVEVRVKGLSARELLPLHETVFDQDEEEAPEDPTEAPLGPGHSLESFGPRNGAASRSTNQ